MKSEEKFKAGIICDNYKLDKFREELELYNFEYVHQPLTPTTTAVQIYTVKSRLIELNDLAVRVDTYFKAQKN